MAIRWASAAAMVRTVGAASSRWWRGRGGHRNETCVRVRVRSKAARGSLEGDETARGGYMLTGCHWHGRWHSRAREHLPGQETEGGGCWGRGAGEGVLKREHCPPLSLKRGAARSCVCGWLVQRERVWPRVRRMQVEEGVRRATEACGRAGLQQRVGGRRQAVGGRRWAVCARLAGTSRTA